MFILEFRVKRITAKDENDPEVSWNYKYIENCSLFNIKILYKRILVALVFIITAAKSFELDCEYEKVGWDDIIGAAFTCKVKNLNITQPKSLITSLRGQHAVGESNDNVNTFLIFEQICDYFPVGVEKYFKNLEGIAVQKSGLKRLTKSDLKPFANLKSISLFGNMLTTLESNLFMFNPKLKLISVFNNKLKHVYPNVFDGLNHLEKVYFSSNPCFNEDGPNPEKIEKVKCKLIESCPATEEMMEYAEIESEKLKTEAEIVRVKESLDAVARNFILSKRKFEKAQENYNLLKRQSSTSNIASCTTISIDLQTCEADKVDLEELIRELEVVEVTCDVLINTGGMFEGNQCTAVGLKVLKPQIKVVNVKRKDKIRLSYESIIKLLVSDQQTLFLPLNIGHFLPKLVKLTVTRSELITINREAFIGLSDLIELDLSQNQLTEVKAANFEVLVNLQKLDLSRNRIDFIEQRAFSSLWSLIELRLNGNQLAILDNKFFKHRPNLKVLMLNNNQLSQIASNFLKVWSSQVEILDMTGNVCIDLKYPDVSLDYLTNHFNTKCTVEIDFECRFESQSGYFCHAENVAIETRNVRVARIKGDHKLNLSNNDVTVLKIVNQTFEVIPQNLGKLMPNLERVWIEGSQLNEIRKESFEGLRNIRELTIKSNMLKEVVDGTFGGFTQLQLLDLSFNSIMSLAERIFENLTSLRTLNLSHNKLTSLNAGMIPTRNVIESFMFSHNSLVSIDPRLIRLLKSAKLIDLEENKCINSKFDEAQHDEKKVMEIFGEASFKCFE